MTTAIVAEYVRRVLWDHGRWAVDIARAIAQRGEPVTLICDAIVDRRQLDDAGDITLIERNPGRTARERQPTRFQRWAMDRLDTLAPQATLSLSRLVPAGLWIPVDPPSAGAFSREIAAISPATLLLEAASRPWIADAIRAERRANRLARAGGVRRWAVAPRPAHDPHARAAHALGVASTLTHTPNSRALRRRLRERLNLAESRPVLLCSLVDRPVSSARSLLEAVARSKRSAGPPAVLILTREPIRAHRLASSLGALTRVRILGATSRMDAMLGACDALALPARAAHATARLAADAIAMHTPVLAVEGAPGAALIEPASFGGPPVGRVLHDVTPGGWQTAMDQVLEPPTLRRMREAAESLAPTVRFDALIDRLVAALARAR